MIYEFVLGLSGLAGALVLALAFVYRKTLAIGLLEALEELGLIKEKRDV